MLPYAYRPHANYSRARHGEFQSFIDECVNKVLLETDIVDADNPYGRKLFNCLDTFFSYGLLAGDKAYWNFVRNFLPRAEQKMLIAECGNANDRFLSIGWLKTSLNKGTLFFIMVALNNQCNKIYFSKFYDVNSCMRNSGMLEAVTEMVDRLTTVQFAFYSTRQLRIEAAPATVIDAPVVQLSTRAAARQRRLTEKEASTDVPNIIPAEIPAVITQAMDQDVLLNELVRNRQNRLNNDLYDNSMQEEAVEEPEVVEEKLEDVMTKKMSVANMESLDPDGIEEILNSVPTPQMTSFAEYEYADGQYELSQGDVLHLAINVFERPSEKITECYKILENFHNDQKVRFFVITNFNVYVFKYILHNQNASPEKTTNLSSDGFFIPTVRMSHDRIQTIKISYDNLSFCIESNEKGFVHYIHNTEHDDQTVMSYAGAMCAMEAGANMIQVLVLAVEHSAREFGHRVELDDHVGYMTQLQPNIDKILRRHVDIRSISLIFWYEQSAAEREHGSVDKSGYLFKTSVGTWMKSSQDAEQKFCMIIAKSLHLFADSTLKQEEMVINLKETSVINMQRNTFQLKGPDGHFEFECGTHEDQEEWVKALTLLTEDKAVDPYYIPCLAVLSPVSVAFVQEGEKFWHDGFLRLLSEIGADGFKKAIAVYPPKEADSYFANRPATFVVIMKDDTMQYFFLRFKKELERMSCAWESCYNMTPEKFDDEMMKTPLGKNIHHTCCSAKNLWPI